MKKKLNYLLIIILFALPIYFAYVFFVEPLYESAYQLRESERKIMEKVKNTDNATLYFEDCSSIIIDKGLLKTISDFEKRYGGENYQSDVTSDSFNYNGNVIYLSLSRNIFKGRRGSRSKHDNICLYKINNNIKSYGCPTFELWYEGFGRDSFYKSSNCQ